MRMIIFHDNESIKGFITTTNDDIEIKVEDVYPSENGWSSLEVPYDKTIIENYPKYERYELLKENDIVTGYKQNAQIAVEIDKPSIIADGADTATITATIDDPESTEIVELWNGDSLVDSQSAIKGVAKFEIVMTEPGTLTLTVKSTTKYGQRDIILEGV